MTKLTPEERWQKHVLERFVALRRSGELDRLRKSGLSILGRKNRFTGEEWRKSFSTRVKSQGYRKWYEECEAVGKRFGLNLQTVACSCLISKYDPNKEPFTMEVQWPRIRVVTGNADPLFLQWLSYEAHRLGLYVVQRQGSSECTVFPMNLPPSRPLPNSQKPPRDTALYLRVETPPGYPPEAAQKLQKKADKLTKELLRCLGYSVPQRLRISPLVEMADKLRVSNDRLASGEAYGVIDDIYGDDNSAKDDDNPAEDDYNLAEDNKKRKLVASRRSKLRKRLIDQYDKP